MIARLFKYLYLYFCPGAKTSYLCTSFKFKIVYMDTKVCSKCGKKLPLERFETGRNQCRDCRNARRKELRDANPSKHREESSKRQKEQTEWIHSLKTKCIICGENEPVCLDFHHKNPAEKDFTIGKNRSKGKENLLKEIKKCVCLCANCHRKVHAGIIDLNKYLNESSPCTTEESVTE